MRWLADENVESVLIEYLRSRDCDVKSIRQDLPQASDEETLAAANLENHIIITNDKSL